MGNASLEMMTAFLTLLQTDSTLMGMVTGVYDEVAVDTPLPYISVETLTEQAWPTFKHINADVLIVAGIWFKWAGYEEGLLLLAQVQRVLRDVKLTLPSYINCQFLFEWSSTMKDQDTSVGHIPFRYHAYAEEK